MAASPESASPLDRAGQPPAAGVSPATPSRTPSGLVSAAALSATRVLSLVLGLAGGTLSAAYFGAGAAKDCLVVSQTIPTLIGTFLISGLYSLLMVSLAEIGPKEGVRGQLALIWKIVVQVGAVLVLLTLVTVLFPRPIIALIAPGFDAEKLDLAGRLLPLAMLSTVFTVSFAAFRALFNTRHQFVVPGLAYSIVGAATIVTLVLLTGRAGIFALALGPLFGAALSAVVLAAAATLLRREAPGAGRPAAPPPPPATARFRFWSDFIPMSIGANFGQLNLAVDNAFASFLPTGSITQLGFASVILSNAELLTIFSLAEVAFARLTAAVQKGGTALEEELRLNLRSMLLLTAPISAGCLVFGVPLSRLLFERGQFDAGATAGVARILACFAPEMLFMGFFALFWRVLAARRRTRALVAISLGAIGLNSVLDYVLMRPFGSSGIALATSGVTTLFAVLMGLQLRREGVRLIAPGDGRYVLCVAGAAAIMAATVWGWATACESLLDPQSETVRLVETGGGLLLGALVYAGVLHAFGVRMVAETLGRMSRSASGWWRG
jgi:putative peptidoglycan lipid II flippase